jgi:hypothetical protein
LIAGLKVSDGLEDATFEVALGEYDKEALGGVGQEGRGRGEVGEVQPRPRRKRGTQSQAIGRSKGGLTTKILALTDALGNLVRFVLLPGHRFDTIGVPPLIDGLSFSALIADTAFDSNAIIADLDERGGPSRHRAASTPNPKAADRR